MAHLLAVPCHKGTPLYVPCAWSCLTSKLPPHCASLSLTTEHQVALLPMCMFCLQECAKRRQVRQVSEGFKGSAL